MIAVLAEDAASSDSSPIVFIVLGVLFLAAFLWSGRILFNVGGAYDKRKQQFELKNQAYKSSTGNLDGLPPLTAALTSAALGRFLTGVVFACSVLMFLVFTILAVHA